MRSSRQHAALLIGLMSLVVASSARAQDEPCAINAALVVSTPTTAYITCELGTRVFEGTGDVSDLTAQGDDPTAPAQPAGSATLSIVTSGRLKFTLVTVSTPLVGGHSYVLSIRTITTVQALNTVTHVWSPLAPGATWGIQHIRFGTKAGALLMPTAGKGERSFFLVSPIAIRQCNVDGSAPQAPVLVEHQAQGDPVLHQAVMRRQSRALLTETDVATSACELPLLDPDTQAPQFNPARIGVAEVWLQRGAFRQASVNLDIAGVVDSFGQALSVPAAKRKLTIGAVPKAKEDSTYYLKVAHEAVDGAAPAWTLDTKLAPVFDRRVFRNFDPAVKLDADVGFGALKGKETVKTTNTIKVGAGLTGLFATGRSTLQAFQFTPVASFEADRDFTAKKNLIVEPDVKLYMPWMNHSRALRSRRAYVERLGTIPPEKWDEIDEESVAFRKIAGFSADITLGVEAGHALREGKVENDAKTSTVVVPKHGILRVRPKLQFTVELWRFSLTGSLTPRFVSVTEPVGELIDGVDPTSGEPSSIASLRDVHGWRTYGEVSLQVGLDRSGHIAFSTSYKRGSTPPTFGDINTVQSGLTIKY
jgi:hypothetical protein